MNRSSLKWRKEGPHVLMASIALAAILLVSPFVSAQYGDYPDLAGDYCRIRTGGNRCCDGRLDTCSMPILGTLCYCDQFCNRTGNPDCCPDYWRVCLGIEPPPSTPSPIRTCKFKEFYIPDGGKVKDNCNECTCINGIVECEEDPCLVDETLLHNIQSNSRRIGWTATNYSQFWGKKLDDGLMMLTGTLLPDDQSPRMFPIKLHYDERQLPKSFDVRQKWDHVDRVRDQGWCASSWAFSTVAVAEDRLTIASGGAEVVQLSTQNLLSCNRRGQQACKGGHVERAWNYLRKIGVVTEECYPYESGTDGSSRACKVRRDATLQSIDCYRKEFPMDRTALYTTEPSYRIASKEGDIMWELMTNGPVQALMRVYQDFFLYKDGVYSKTNLDSTGKFSIHSVKLLGWGEEPSFFGPPTKYWLVTNSWGENWGMEGTFKIQRGTNESSIETFVLGVRMHLAEKAGQISRQRQQLLASRNRPSRSF